MRRNALPLFAFVCAFLFALFPLTDTDIWWHLACAREWVVTWSPARGGLPNIHEYFQQVVYAVYSVGGAPLLVVFKALLWALVFALFLRGRHGDVFRNPVPVAASAVVLFVFRFQLEMRPVLFSLVFLGIYWNAVPWLLPRLQLLGERRSGRAWERSDLKTVGVALALLAVQWVWCRVQGLYILGALFALLCLLPVASRRSKIPALFVVALFAMPFLHRNGLATFLYPFGLLDRLLGLSPSAASFASGIAENRSPVTLLLAGENALASTLMVVFALAGIALAVYRVARSRENLVLWITLFVTSVMALSAERNFVLFLPVFLSVLVHSAIHIPQVPFPAINQYSSVVVLAFLLGCWARSVVAYDSWIAYQRVPVGAAAWMKSHPHEGRLFNDDRAGGYLAFVNPADSVYIDGRFILKTADFFERYMRYSEAPGIFLFDMESSGVDRAVFPLRYYARWGKVLAALEASPEWRVAYVDAYFIVFARK